MIYEQEILYRIGFSTLVYVHYPFTYQYIVCVCALKLINH